MTHKPIKPKVRYFICTLDAGDVELKYLIATKQPIAPVKTKPISKEQYAKQVFATILDSWTADQEAWESLTGKEWSTALDIDYEITIVEIPTSVADMLKAKRIFTCHNEWDF